MTFIEVCRVIEGMGFERQKPNADWSHFRPADEALVDVQETRWALSTRRGGVRKGWKPGYTYNGYLPETEEALEVVLSAVHAAPNPAGGPDLRQS